MSSRITGELSIDLDVDVDLTEDQYRKFKIKLESFVEEYEDEIYDLAHDCGFEIQSIHPLLLDYVEYTNTNEEKIEDSEE